MTYGSDIARTFLVLNCLAAFSVATLAQPPETTLDRLEADAAAAGAKPPGEIIGAIDTKAEPGWTYQKTGDGQVALGRAAKAISLEVNGGRTEFKLPEGVTAISAVDEPMDWLYSLLREGTEVQVGIITGPAKPGEKVEDAFKQYLESIHQMHDPKVTMALGPEFTLPGGRKVPSMIYSSEYWKNRLVVIIPEERVRTMLELGAGSPDDLKKETPVLEQLLAGYQYKALAQP